MILAETYFNQSVNKLTIIKEATKMTIREISKNEIRTSCVKLTVSKDGIILMLNPNNFQTILRLNEARSINTINGFDIRKNDNVKVVSSEILTDIVNNNFDSIKLNLTDDQKKEILRKLNENYRHEYLLDIALCMFQYHESNKLEEEIKSSMSIDDMRKRVLAYDLEQALVERVEEEVKKVKI